ncbi:DUF1203 domain-containing protein [Acerihabitans sp. TG2]|uniref:DUF1203 domain-containing protein n=1 Tax=Acerihabitans sp. TG2 TaxID=3096008 RepID=UPI002B23454E|nr:DUF1203 domain-containing protein [Acerihabitans sp. TG2]MEA9392356.1 DUF1203 domain-containing protein [Acerihabitans sp. TG2]
MSYIIKGLDGSVFEHLYGLSDCKLQEHGAIRINVDKPQAYPDRISLRDIPVGEYAILLNHTFLDSPTPYRGSHAIFIWEGKKEAAILTDCIPEVMISRTISLRAFDNNDMMIDAAIASNEKIEENILIFFENTQIKYILAHNAKQGCFSCRITLNNRQNNTFNEGEA